MIEKIEWVGKEYSLPVGLAFIKGNNESGKTRLLKQLREQVKKSKTWNDWKLVNKVCFMLQESHPLHIETFTNRIQKPFSKRVKEILTEIAKVRTDLEFKIKELEKKKEELDYWDKEKLKRELTIYCIASKNLRRELDDLERKNLETRRKITELQDRLATQQDKLKKLTRLKEEIEETKREFSKLLARKEAIENDLKSLLSTRRLRQLEKDTGNKYNSLKEDTYKLWSKVQSLNTSNFVCPLTQKPCPNPELLEKEKEKVKQELQGKVKKLKEVEKEYDRIWKDLQRRLWLEEELKHVAGKIKKLSFTKEIENLTTEIEDTKKEIAYIEKVLNEDLNIERDVIALETKLKNEYLNKHDRFLKLKETYLSYIQLEKDLVRLQEEKEQCKYKLHSLCVLCDVLKEFPRNVIKALLKELEIEINTLLVPIGISCEIEYGLELGKEAYCICGGKFKDEQCVICGRKQGHRYSSKISQEIDGLNPVFLSFSQKRIVEIATRIALANVIRMHGYENTDFVVIDDIDLALDEESKRKVKEMLEVAIGSGLNQVIFTAVDFPASPFLKL